MAKLSSKDPSVDPTLAPAADPSAPAPEVQVAASDAQVEAPEPQVAPAPESEIEPAPTAPITEPVEAPVVPEGMLQAEGGEVFPKPTSFIITVADGIDTVEAFALHGIKTALTEFPNVKRIDIPTEKLAAVLGAAQ